MSRLKEYFFHWHKAEVYFLVFSFSFIFREYFYHWHPKAGTKSVWYRFQVSKRALSIQVFCSSWLHVVDSLPMWAQATDRHVKRVFISSRPNNTSSERCYCAFMRWYESCTAYSNLVSIHQYIIILQAERNDFSTHAGIGEETSCWKTSNEGYKLSRGR